MNDKKYFEVFTKYQHDKYELYNEVKALIQEEIIDARGVENAKFYEVLVALNNSENNQRWEERHSERISFTNKAMVDIAEDYNEYLP